MSKSDESSDNLNPDLKSDALMINLKPDQERSASDVQDDQERKINKCNDDKSLTEKVQPQYSSASSLEAMPIKSKPEQKRSVSNIEDDQEKAITKCNDDRSSNQKVNSQYSSDSSLDLKTDAMPVIPELKKSFPNLPDVNVMTQFMGQLRIGNINAQNIQLGSHNTMYVPAEDTKEKVTKKKFEIEEQFKLYLESDKILKPKDLTNISSVIGKKWKAIGRYLDIEDAKLDEIDYNYNKDGLNETVYQMLRYWSQKSPSECTVGTLARAFIDSNNLELISVLPLDD